MPDPRELLSVSRHLVAASAPSDAAVRRSISTAYYAVFHAVLRRAADLFVGEDRRSEPAYALLYRGFEHTHMRRQLESLDRPTLGDKAKRALGGRSFVSRDMRSFAAAFAGLQDLRTYADYDPQVQLTGLEARTVVEEAADAIDIVGRVPPDELRDVLAYLLFRTRD